MRRESEADLRTVAWPLSLLSEALEIVARRSGLRQHGMAEASPAGSAPSDHEALVRWLGAAAAQLGIEMEPAEVPYAELERALHRAAPALIEISPNGTQCFLALVGSGRKVLRVLGPDLIEHRISPETISAGLRSTFGGVNAGNVVFYDGPVVG